jgi:hypothetical protein
MGDGDDDEGFQFTVFPHCCVPNHGVAFCELQYVLYIPDLLSLPETITCIRELETRDLSFSLSIQLSIVLYSSTMERFSLLSQPFLSLHRFCARLQRIILAGKAYRCMAGTFTAPSYFIIRTGFYNAQDFIATVHKWHGVLE